MNLDYNRYTKINPARATMDIPDGLRAEVKEWLCRVFGNSPCYGWVLSYRDMGLDCIDWTDGKTERIAELRKRLADRKQAVEDMVEEWRTHASCNLNYDCLPWSPLRNGRVSIPMYGFYQEFGFLPRIADLRKLFGEIFDEDMERVEALENLDREQA